MNQPEALAVLAENLVFLLFVVVETSCPSVES